VSSTGCIYFDRTKNVVKSANQPRLGHRVVRRDVPDDGLREVVDERQHDALVLVQYVGLAGTPGCHIGYLDHLGVVITGVF
jgi:hypothetical protein